MSEQKVRTWARSSKILLKFDCEGDCGWKRSGWEDRRNGGWTECLSLPGIPASDFLSPLLHFPDPFSESLIYVKYYKFLQ